MNIATGISCICRFASGVDSGSKVEGIAAVHAEAEVRISRDKQRITNPLPSRVLLDRIRDLLT